MKKLSVICFMSLFTFACASSPEIPEGATPPTAKQVNQSKPLIEDSLMNDLRSDRRWKKAVARRIASRVREVQQDCKIYQKPTLMSPSTSDVESGRDVWTEDTNTSWFRVYKDNSYGYVSKICFENI